VARDLPAQRLPQSVVHARDGAATAAAGAERYPSGSISTR
jgi:hypothetical protein